MPDLAVDTPLDHIEFFNENPQIEYLVITSIPGFGDSYYRWRAAGGLSGIITRETADKLEEEGRAFIHQVAEVLGDIDWAAIGEAVGKVAAAVATASGEAGLGFVRGIGPALVEGIRGAYDAIAEVLDDQESNVIAGLTVAVLVIVTAIYLYHEITRGPSSS